MNAAYSPGYEIPFRFGFRLSGLRAGIQSLSLEAGSYRTFQPHDTTHLSGGGLRFGYSFTERFEAEATTSFSQMTGMVSAGDAWTVVTLGAQVNYVVAHDGNSRFMIYGGARRVTTASNARASNYGSSLSQAQIDENEKSLSGWMPALGVSLVYHVASLWNARFNVGWDAISAGMTVAF